MEETIRWVPVSEPPDDEITVLLWAGGAWPAYLKGGDWYWDDGMEVTSFPAYWAEMPKGPKR